MACSPDPPRSARQRRREHLIDAAISVFATADRAPAYDEFARAAGVSRGTYYNHFPDRTALQSAAILRILSFTARETRPLITPDQDPALTLAIILRGILDLCTTNPAWGLALSQLSPTALATTRRHDPAGIVATLARGARTQRFSHPDHNAALDLIEGCLITALSSVLQSNRPKHHLNIVLALVLQALGISQQNTHSIISQLPNLNITAHWFNN